jgi:hypothetical protein
VAIASFRRLETAVDRANMADAAAADWTIGLPEAARYFSCLNPVSVVRVASRTGGHSRFIDISRPSRCNGHAMPRISAKPATGAAATEQSRGKRANIEQGSDERKRRPNARCSRAAVHPGSGVLAVERAGGAAAAPADCREPWRPSGWLARPRTIVDGMEEWFFGFETFVDWRPSRTAASRPAPAPIRK